MLCDDPTVKPLVATGAAAGIDAGLDHLLTLSTGEKIATPGTNAATGRRHAVRSPGSMPGSRTGAGTACTS